MAQPAARDTFWTTCLLFVGIVIVCIVVGWVVVGVVLESLQGSASVP